jgi:phosphopantothenoylcysteine decarboxylase / phosphopantothenate---cysteine ligase
MRPFEGRHILLGVTGGIASYKTAWLARLLAQAGAAVDVVMTRAAQEFIGAVTLEALTGRPVHRELFGGAHALEHIRLAQRAELFVVAPATADFLARAAHGLADDLLTACLLATEAPVLFVPAMNDRMWAHAQTRHNVNHLRGLGYQVLEPEEGLLAAGEGSGPGRMPEPERILAHIGRALERRGALAGRRLVVSAGPTREPVDPVRFLSNRSSGKMGVAIASAAWRRGAEVELIAGPLAVAPPPDVRVTSVETTEEMAGAVRAALAEADVLIMAAAPADFAPREALAMKIKKADAPEALPIAPTIDILQSTRGDRAAGCVVVGFALETGGGREAALSKLQQKGLDLIVLNDALEPGAGFSVDTNRVTILDRSGGVQELPLLDKRDVADAILDRVEALLRD